MDSSFGYLDSQMQSCENFKQENEDLHSLKIEETTDTNVLQQLKKKKRKLKLASKKQSSIQKWLYRTHEKYKDVVS